MQRVLEKTRMEMVNAEQSRMIVHLQRQIDRLKAHQDKKEMQAQMQRQMDRLEAGQEKRELQAQMQREISLLRAEVEKKDIQRELQRQLEQNERRAFEERAALQQQIVIRGSGAAHPSINQKLQPCSSRL